jgi:hypothetical protein
LAGELKCATLRVDPQGKKACEDRNSLTCTLSQNGYGTRFKWRGNLTARTPQKLNPCVWRFGKASPTEASMLAGSGGPTMDQHGQPSDPKRDRDLKKQRKRRKRRHLIKADSTLRCSQAVPHPSTNRALRRLTSEVGRDPVHSTRYGRRRKLTAATMSYTCRRGPCCAYALQLRAMPLMHMRAKHQYSS